MALGESLTLTSPVKMGSTNVALIFGSGSPDGDAAPFSDALKGSLYIQTNPSDDVSAVWMKVDEDSADDDWVKILVESDTTARNISGAYTFTTTTRAYWRDSGLYIYSPADGELRIGADTKLSLGDGTNQVEIQPDGEIQLAGTAKVTRKVPLPLDAGHGTADVEEFKGAPSINLDADTEEWLLSFGAPNDWDAASDLTLVFMVANEIAEDDGDDVSFTCQVRGYADGEAVSDAGQTVACTLNLTGGDEAIDVVNRVTGTIDYDEGTYPIAVGDTVVVKAAVNLGGAGECTGPLHILAQWVEYTANKLGAAT